MKIKFLKTSKYKSVAPKHLPGQLSYVTTTYEEGKTYDLPDDHASRFIRRGHAEAVGKSAPALNTPIDETPRPEVPAGYHLKTASAK